MTRIVRYDGNREILVREDPDLPEPPIGRVYVYDFGGRLIADLPERPLQ